MRHQIIPTVHLITTILRLVRPGGLRAVIVESVLAKQQLLILNHALDVKEIKTVPYVPLSHPLKELPGPTVRFVDFSLFPFLSVVNIEIGLTGYDSTVRAA